MLPLKTTKDAAKLSKTFHKHYKIQNQPTNYNISSFEEIGMVDPFPKDKIQKRPFLIPK